MTKFKFIVKSFLFYLKANLLVAIGIAISSAVLTGGLIIGDSVKNSLTEIVNLRLGETTHSILAGDRFFRMQLANELESEGNLQAAPVLLSEAIAIADGGAQRANRVQVIGIDSSFAKISGSKIFSGLGRNEIFISKNLAERLLVGEGDFILLRIKKESLVPLNAPFVSDAETNVSFRALIKGIVSKEELGRFSLKNSQTAPFNVFMDINRLNNLMEFQAKANTILINSELEVTEISSLLKKVWKPKDANLEFRNIKKRAENEIITERVFLDFPIFDSFGTMPEAEGILTYFVNDISKTDQSEGTPYSFISTLPENELAENEAVINRWLASDLNVKTGDSLVMRYFVVGPLRKLIVKESRFVVKQIVGMDSEFADGTLMPFLPGMSDAGHCSEWEAGVPIDLDKIRDKDEDYWNRFRGTPKAFISINKAQEIWANRFGNYTSVRFPENQFSYNDFLERFQKSVDPLSLGFMVAPVKEQGKFAAQNGVDFSQLFIGLSFFLLASAILLSALLFLLNLENRLQQAGTLATIGFKQAQVKQLFLTEGVLISAFGSLVGILLSVAYTKLIFMALNSLWNDIVRTNALEVNVVPLTLIYGFVISVFISVFVIYISLHRKLKQQVADIQKKIYTKSRRWIKILKIIVALIFSLISVFLIISQFLLNEKQNPSFFFMSGGLLLIALLLFADLFLNSKQKNTINSLSYSRVSAKNITRNKSRSLTILILFAIGTFIVISTGSNKNDVISGANEKESGSGGFLYYAETTIPVLNDLNLRENRAVEGLSDDYNIVQFRKIEGDDASCLNLNRIANPAVLGVDPELLNGRFSFVSKSESLNEESPWLSLNAETSSGVIPAIADQTVIQWGLGKKVGDTLFYQNEGGDTIALHLIGGLAPSIFQGNVLISNNQFLKNYPSSSGSEVFLIDGENEKRQEISDELNLAFRDYGWEQKDAAQRLVEFYSITNTYLSIFLALGALALILGTFGLVIVIARSILERKQEIALFQAVGFKKVKIFGIILREYTMLLVAGVFIGFITAVVATLPSLLSKNTDASFGIVAIIVAIIIINGIAWIAGLTWISLRKRKLATALRNE